MADARTSSWSRMSEGRQLALLLVGGLLLVAVGIGAATLVPEPCEDLEGIGTLELSFTDAVAVLPASVTDPAAVEAMGEALGVGPWRGAVALPAGADLLPSDFGFFVVTESDLVALRPGSGLASAPRDVTGLDAVSVSGTSVGLVTEDGRIVVVASDYERERCGGVPAEARVLAVDRGVAVLGTGADVLVRTLSGEDVARFAPPDPVESALLVGDRLVVATGTALLEGDVRDDAAGLAPAAELGRVLAAAGERVVVVTAAAPTTVVDRQLAGDEAVRETSVGTATALDAVPTPAGTVVLTDDALVTDRGGRAELPAGLAPTSLHASLDGQVGLLVEGRDGPVLLTWGRDLDAG